MGLMNYVIEAIIGVIILVVFLPLIFHSAKNVMYLIEEKVGILSYNPVEKAILCSYYICHSGCSSMEVMKYCNDNQYEEACSIPISLGLGDKICNEASERFPVEVYYSESSIDIERLGKKTGYKCIDTNKVSDSKIYLSKSLFSKGDWNKKCGGYTRVLLLKNKKVYIFTVNENTFKTHWRSTVIDNHPKYLILNKVGDTQTFDLYQTGDDFLNKYYLARIKILGKHNCIASISYIGNDHNVKNSIIYLSCDFTSGSFVISDKYNGHRSLCKKVDNTNYFCLNVIKFHEKGTIRKKRWLTIRINLSSSVSNKYTNPFTASRKCGGTYDCEISTCSLGEDTAADGWCKEVYGKNYFCCASATPNP